jgi:tRNA pseudouridine38-40 synthase
MRYALTLSYDGSGFYGWQIQPHERSIQETLQQALGTLLGCEIAVTGAGRTDTDVNAFEYIAHFDYVGVLPYECADFIFKLNAILPQEICILDLREVDSDFHARFDACKRTYHYFIHFKKDPFVRHYSWYCKYKLDVEAMQRACQYLIGTQDFACFEKKGADSKTTLCTLYEAKWEFYRPSLQSVCGKDSGESYLCFTVSANRFLRNMVRAIVGTMIEIGRGRMKAEDLPEVLASKNRCRAGQSVPGNALFLTKVEY